MATNAERTYLPAAGRDWALPFYDPLVAALGGRRTRDTLIAQAELRPGFRVLEIGCGTGTLLMAISHAAAGIDLVGLDPDPKALAYAERKAKRAGVPIRLDRGFADALPYADASFDRVFSSFMFHHLPSRDKEPALREVARVLKPGGRLELLDFAAHAHHRLMDNAPDRIAALMTGAGLIGARRVGGGTMLFGLVRYNRYQASVRSAS